MKPPKAAQNSAEAISYALRAPDRFLEESVATARASMERCVSDAANYARQQPEKALLSAIIAGYVLRMLPVGGLVRLSIRLALALIKPAVIIYGGAKVWSQIQPSAPSPQRNEGA